MLFVGDDWAEDHHDVEIVDEAGRRLARRRLPEGAAGVSELHGLIAERLGEDAGPDQVVIGIETERGPWVRALRAAGYEVFAINPMQVARYRERHSTSGAKSDRADAHVLAELVRLDRDHHRPVAEDSAEAEAVKVLARGASKLGPGPSASAQSAAFDAAGVLPGCAGRVRLRPGLPGRAGGTRRGRHPGIRAGAGH